MIDFLGYCNKISKLQVEAEAEILASIRTLSLQKGDFLLRKGQICGFFSVAFVQNKRL